MIWESLISERPSPIDFNKGIKRDHGKSIDVYMYAANITTDMMGIRTFNS